MQSASQKSGFETIAVWCTRSLTGLLVYLAMEMRADIKVLSHDVPVMQEQIRLMQGDQQRLTNKVFTVYMPAKKPDEINFSYLIKKRS